MTILRGQNQNHTGVYRKECPSCFRPLLNAITPEEYASLVASTKGDE